MTHPKYTFNTVDIHTLIGLVGVNINPERLTDKAAQALVYRCKAAISELSSPLITIDLYDSPTLSNHKWI